MNAQFILLMLVILGFIVVVISYGRLGLGAWTKNGYEERLVNKVEAIGFLFIFVGVVGSLLIHIPVH